MRRHQAGRRKPVEIAAKIQTMSEDQSTLLGKRGRTRSTDLDKLELVMGKLVGYGLRKPAFAGEMGYMLGVCL